MTLLFLLGCGGGHGGEGAVAPSVVTGETEQTSGGARPARPKGPPVVHLSSGAAGALIVRIAGDEVSCSAGVEPTTDSLARCLAPLEPGASATAYVVPDATVRYGLLVHVVGALTERGFERVHIVEPMRELEVLEGTAEPDELLPVVDRGRIALLSCFVEGDAEGTDEAASAFRVGVTLDATGKVATVEPLDPAPPALFECVEGQVQRWVFEGVDAPARFVFPVVFQRAP